MSQTMPDTTSATTTTGATTGATTAEEGIRRTLALQAHLRDDGNLTEWPDNFTEDASFTSPAGTFRGRDNIAVHLNDVYARGGKGGRHLVGASVIDVDGDHAVATTDFTFVAPSEDGSLRILAAGRYDDRLVHHVDGRWRFEDRVVSLLSALHHEPIESPAIRS